MKKDITQIEQLYSTQQKEWKISWIFWTLMSLLLIARIFGLFGNGLISEKTYSTNSIHIAYNKFMRVDKDSQIYIQVHDLGQQAAIGINNDYLSF